MLRRPPAFARAAGGAIAVEFALIAPVLLLMFFGSFELARALDCRTRVIDAASTVADLVAQNSDTAITASTAQTILCAAKGILYPYSTSGTITLRITSVVCNGYDSVNATCPTAKIAIGWSRYTSNTTARTAVPADLPATTFTATGSGAVMVETTYTYSSPTTQFLASTITMKKTAYSISRNVTAITGSSGTITDCALS
jgi:Flp pilus assembly protein TadG